MMLSIFWNALSPFPTHTMLQCRDTVLQLKILSLYSSTHRRSWSQTVQFFVLAFWFLSHNNDVTCSDELFGQKSVHPREFICATFQNNAMSVSCQAFYIFIKSFVLMLLVPLVIGKLLLRRIQTSEGPRFFAEVLAWIFPQGL